MTPNNQTQELINDLGMRINRPPLNKLRDNLANIPEVVRVIILIIDFDVEVHMNGMLGFLENSIGLYFEETIEAFRTIGARETTRILEDIRSTMSPFGVSTTQLRGNLQNSEEYEITSFNETHGEATGIMGEQIEELASQLYLYHPQGENITELLKEYVEPQQEIVLQFMHKYEAE